MAGLGAQANSAPISCDPSHTAAVLPRLHLPSALTSGILTLPPKQPLLSPPCSPLSPAKISQHYSWLPAWVSPISHTSPLCLLLGLLLSGPRATFFSLSLTLPQTPHAAIHVSTSDSLPWFRFSSLCWSCHPVQGLLSNYLLAARPPFGPCFSLLLPALLWHVPSSLASNSGYFCFWGHESS